MRHLKQLDNVWFWMVLGGLFLATLPFALKVGPILYVVSIVVYTIFLRLANRKVYDSMFFRRIMPTWYKFGWIVFMLLAVSPSTLFLLGSWGSGNMVEFWFWVFGWVIAVGVSFVMFRERNTDLAKKFIKKNAKS